MPDMLCSIPSPCGAEELLKKYLAKKISYETYEDGIGNLILHLGSGVRKMMVCVSVDEDALVVMSKKNDKIYFAHLGRTTLYPGMTVNFGGYKGVICSEGDKPDEAQFIKMLGENNVDVGATGVIEGEYYEEDDLFFAKHTAEKLAVVAMMENAAESSLYDVYFVFGVQGGNGCKGLIAASDSIKPDMVFAFEPIKATDKEMLTLKLLTGGYTCSNRMREYICRLCEDNKIGLEYSVTPEEKSCADVIRCSNTAVIGIPVRFYDMPRQAVKKEILSDLKKLIGALLSGEVE